MKRREVLVAAAATPLLTAFACKTAGADPRREDRDGDARPLPRNLLVVVSDDQSRFDLGAYGNPACATPHIDRLADEGLRFRTGYTPVSLCMPARSCLYTGLYPHRNGATGFEPVRPGVKTWPNWLGAACATGMVGKLNVLPAEQFPFEFMKRGGLNRKFGRSPERYERLFAEFLTEVGGRRFAAVVNLKDPHRPFDEDRFVDEVPGAPPSGFDPEAAWIPGCLWDTPATRQELADYYAALQRMDETCGRVLRLLAEAGRADDTLVVFSSDNGMPFPFAKSTLYEAGINVPFIARWPGVVEPGGESDAFVSLVDLLPTALDAMGLLEAIEPGTFDGYTLLPLLRGERPAVRERVWSARSTSCSRATRPPRARSATRASSTSTTSAPRSRSRTTS